MLQSFAVTNANAGIQYLFYDTVLDGKHLITAVGVGRVRNGDAEITPVAQQTLEAVIAYAENANGAGVTVALQEIATVKAAPVRVAKALKAASEKSVVFFVCRSPDIYDAAVLQLAVQWESSFGGAGVGNN